jgi:hypothetical protein
MLKIGIERIQRLQREKMFFETTLLYGLEEIGHFLGWSESKLKTKLAELQDAGAIFQNRIGSPPAKVWCSYPCLLLRFVSLKGQKREVL